MGDATNETQRGVPVPVWIEAFTGPWTWTNLRNWALIIGGILLFMALIMQQFSIPSGSMEPTLHGDPGFLRGDRVLVNKWIYGPRIPFTTWRFWKWKEPERFEIVVFKPRPEQSPHPILIKRVMGLPGERVHIENGKVHINGEAIELPEDMPEATYYVADADLARAAQRAENPAQRDTILRMRQQYPLRYGVREEDEYAVIPEGHYMMLGDNSLHSVDSRVYGWVENGQILGRAFAVWWPFSRRQDFTGFSDTWWGKLFIYGIPTVLIGSEIARFVYARRRREDEGEAESGAS